MRLLVRYFLLGLVLLLVGFSSALLAMRFAIHGREVRVPRLQGLPADQAERLASAEGLVLSIDNRYYSADLPAGYIISQSPAPQITVRRGWKVRVTESLGPQRAAIPQVVGQSERLAQLNINRHGLELGTVAVIHLPGAPSHAGDSSSSSVIAQSPSPDEKNVSSPKIGLVVLDPDNSQSYVMPSFVGQPLSEVSAAIKQAGFTLGKVDSLEDTSGPSGVVLRQSPAPGQKIEAGATISLVARK